jgi:flagellar basal-body rod protein FlgB
MRLLDTLFDQSVTGLSRTMDLTWKRNKALSANIANAETPQYRAIDVSFGNELERAFQSQGGAGETGRTNSAHIDITGKTNNSQLVKDLSGATKPDGNNVDIDLQMGRLAQNSGDYANAARLIRRQIGLLRTAIRESR